VAAAVGWKTAGRVLGHGSLGATSGKPAPVPERKDPDALDIAIAERRRFYCTQFVVWLYNVVSSRILHRGRGAILMDDKEAVPGYLAEVLHKRSSNFVYVGCIRSSHSAGDIKKLF
jgi:hypothetical protein